MEKLSWKSVLLGLVLLQTSLHTVYSQSNCNSGLENLQNSYGLPTSEADARFLTSSTTSREGVQVIVPQMSFGCTGRITSWNVHTLVLTKPNFVEALTHHITFQVWRPLNTPTSSYTLVGSNRLSFSSPELSNGITYTPSTNQTAFFSFNKTVSQEEEIYFNQGDVLGWYISPQFGTISPPLSPLYRAPLRTDASSSVVDMLVDDAAQESCVLCSVEEGFQVYLSIVPLLSVTYEIGGQERTCPDNQMCNLTTTQTLPITTPTATTTSSSGTSGELTDSSQTLRIAEIVCIAIAAATLILHVIMIVLCALNLTVMRQIRKSMKSGVMPISPSMRLQPIFKHPSVEQNTPANYEALVHTPANYEKVQSTSNYEMIDGRAKHDKTNNTIHKHMLQSGYDEDASPQLGRSMVHHSRHGSKDDLLDSDSNK